MSMIKCPECGKEISDLAKNCPNCGFPIGFESVQNIPSNNYPQPNARPTVTVKPYIDEKKQSKLGILALVLSIIGCTFWLAIILAIVDLFKKDETKKTCSIAAICVSIFWIVLALSVGGSDNEEPKSTSNSTSTVSEQLAEPITETVQETKEEPKEQETEKVEEPKPQDKYYVGDTWNNKYVLVSFDDCGEYESDNQFIQPADGKRFIYGKFTFENIGSSDTTVGYWDFDCYADGYACDGTYGADDSAFSQTLSSGRKMSGSIYYEVPVSASEIEFEFSPSFWTSEKIVFVYQ